VEREPALVRALLERARASNDAPLADSAALRTRLAEASQRKPQPELHLRADQQVRYQSVAEVMAAAQQAGVSKIGFVTDPKPAGSPR
jgi:biopolymer transport protein ExbD